VDLQLSRRAVPLLVERESATSTNTDLAALAIEGDLPDYATVVTLDQTAGRGRLDRVWVAPRGAALAVSVLVPFPAEAGEWVPLAAGVAMADAVAGTVAPDRVRLKWPNDVLLDDRKLCGILAELTESGVIVGAGVNLATTAEQLPVPTATSLAIAGVVVDPATVDALLARYLRALRDEIERLRRDGPAALRARVRALCSTLDREVRVELPDGREALGRAVDIDESGRLIVRTAEGERAFSVGDVTHVRAAPGPLAE
jgi:BirA family biotin operon repressor/biotin-[acetyl-CoA-carboxylase] ligase